MACKTSKFFTLICSAYYGLIPGIGARLAAICISSLEEVKFSIVQFFFFEPGYEVCVYI